MDSNTTPGFRMLAQDVVRQIDGLSATDVSCFLREAQRLIEQKAWNPRAVTESIKAEIRPSYSPNAADS